MRAHMSILYESTLDILTTCVNFALKNSTEFEGAIAGGKKNTKMINIVPSSLN